MGIYLSELSLFCKRTIITEFVIRTNEYDSMITPSNPCSLDCRFHYLLGCCATVRATNMHFGQVKQTRGEPPPPHQIDTTVPNGYLPLQNSSLRCGDQQK